jgi:hypothetical protein
VKHIIAPGCAKQRSATRGRRRAAHAPVAESCVARSSEGCCQLVFRRVSARKVSAARQGNDGLRSSKVFADECLCSLLCHSHACEGLNGLCVHMPQKLVYRRQRPIGRRRQRDTIVLPLMIGGQHVVRALNTPQYYRARAVAWECAAETIADQAPQELMLQLAKRWRSLPMRLRLRKAKERRYHRCLPQSRRGVMTTAAELRAEAQQLREELQSATGPTVLSEMRALLKDRSPPVAMLDNRSAQRPVQHTAHRSNPRNI